MEITSQPALLPASSYLLTPNIFHPNPTIVSAHRTTLTLDDGRKIIDATGGPAVAIIGHGHPDVKRAVLEQMDQLSYCHSLLWGNSASEELAKELIQSTDGKLSKALFYSSGSEAIDALLKLARQYYLELGQQKRVHFIARDGSFHGTTIGSLALTGKKGPRTQFEPLLPSNVSFISACHPYRGQWTGEDVTGYVQRLAKELDEKIELIGADKVCGVLLETVSGTSLGCVPPPPGYLAAMKAVCEKHGILFLLDEAICGMGRTGTWHAWQHDGVVPDIQAVAKGLGGGYAPISGVLVSEKCVQALAQGSGFFNHGHTYQSHPVACAAALEVQRIVKRENLVQNAAIMGQRLGQALWNSLGHHPNVGDIRGRGLFYCVELVKDKETKQPFPVGDRVSFRLRNQGLKEPYSISLYSGNGSADGLNGDHLLVSPAYNSTAEEIDIIVEKLTALIEDFIFK